MRNRNNWVKNNLKNESSLSCQELRHDILCDQKITLESVETNDENSYQIGKSIEGFVQG